MVASWKELWKSAGFTLGILRSNTPVITREEALVCFFVIQLARKQKNKKTRGSVTPKWRENYTDIVERLCSAED